MNSEKLKKYIYPFLATIVVAYCVKEALGNGDFKVYLEAAKTLRTGNSPYNEWFFVSEGNYCLYLYSPLWATLLVPFSYVHYFIPHFLWLLGNLIFLYRSFQILHTFIDRDKLSNKQLFWLVFLSFAMSIRFIIDNFAMLQMTLFMLWGALESLRFFTKDKPLQGAALLALMINIKLLPLVLLPYLLYRSYYKGFLFTLVFSVAYLFLPSLYLGWTTNNMILAEWLAVINPTNAEHLVEFKLGPHSLTALIPTLLSETEGQIELTRNILNLSETTVNLILNSVRLMLVVLSIYFFKWPPFSTREQQTP